MTLTPQSTAELYELIMSLVEQRAAKAAQSEYDRSVCITAIAAARKAVESIPVVGSSAEYYGAVKKGMSILHRDYNDTDGQYTNGRAAIGDLLHDIASMSL